MGSGASSSSGSAVLYSFPVSPPCRAVLMTAKLAKINLTVKNLNLLRNEHMESTFLELNPDRTVPTLVDGSLILWESRAIQQYLLDKYSPNHSLYPRDPIKRAYVDRMLQYDITNIPAIIKFTRPQLVERKPADPEKQKEAEKVLDYLENILKKHKYLAGDQLTIADLSVLAYVSALDLLSWDYSRWPKLEAWEKSLTAQPWYIKPDDGFQEMSKEAADQKAAGK